MLFTELVHAIHPHLMKDADVPDFMRNLIQMLCDIPEEDWSTKKDSSSEQSNKDSSLRKFYNYMERSTGSDTQILTLNFTFLWLMEKVKIRYVDCKKSSNSVNIYALIDKYTE